LAASTVGPPIDAGNLDTQPLAHVENRPIKVGIRTIERPQVQLERASTSAPRNTRSHLQRRRDENVLGTKRIGRVVLRSSHGPLSMRALLRTRDRRDARLGVVRPVPTALHHANVHARGTRDSCERRTAGSNPRSRQEGQETPVEGHGDVNGNYDRDHQRTTSEGGRGAHLRGCAARSEGGASPTSHHDNEPHGTRDSAHRTANTSAHDKAQHTRHHGSDRPASNKSEEITPPESCNCARRPSAIGDTKLKPHSFLLASQHDLSRGVEPGHTNGVEYSRR